MTEIAVQAGVETATEALTFKEKKTRFLEKWEDILGLGGTKKDIWLLVISAVALVASLIWGSKLPVDPAWIAIILCGVPIVCEALIGLIDSFDITADVLVATALIASIIIGEYFAAGEVALIMQLGGLLEELTVARAQRGIERLVALSPRTARILAGDGSTREVAVEEVSLGDVLQVLPGEVIPTDGIILTGNTSIDQSTLTGESLPVDKGPDDEVFSGTVNQFGAITMRVIRAGEDSSIQRMTRLVKSADAKKAKIVRFADKAAVWIVIGAFTIAVAAWAITGEVLRAVTVLVVFCPCSLVLATPTAIVAATGNATKHGFLVKEGDALERLAQVSRVMFDKTGTLTQGELQVEDVAIAGGASMDESQVMVLLSGAESLSEHPLGRAVVAYAKERGMEVPQVADVDFTMIPGRGVVAMVEGVRVVAGNDALLEEQDVALDVRLLAKAEAYRAKGWTVVDLAADGEHVASVALGDTLRNESAAVVAELHELGLETTMLTGDTQAAARTIANELGVTDVVAGCRPEDKLNYVDAQEEAGVKACMVGDGVNDAPALKRSFVGIAMGGVGSDIAVEAADIVMVEERIERLPHIVALAQHTMRVIKANITFAMALNLLAVTLAVLAVLDPVTGALVHNAGSVLVVSNSALLLNWIAKKKAKA